jgi:hypothetical protein
MLSSNVDSETSQESLRLSDTGTTSTHDVSSADLDEFLRHATIKAVFDATGQIVG